MDGHEIVEVNLSAVERTKRIDAEFYKKENIAVDSILSSWNKKSIADWILRFDLDLSTTTDIPTK